MKTRENDPDTLETTIRGARAVVDYSGLVAWSILSRTVSSTEKLCKRIGHYTAEPFTSGRKKTRKTRNEMPVSNGEAMTVLKDRIALIEERLANLEKHGVKTVGTRAYQQKRKELDEERKGLLALIVDENKELKALLNKG